MSFDYDASIPFSPSPNHVPTYGDFLYWLGLFVDKGEYALIFADNRTPYQLIKVANLDLTDGDANYDLSEFIEDNWKRNIEGLVKVHSFTKCIATPQLKKTFFDKIRESGAKVRPLMQILDMDTGDEMAMWVMEKVAFVGLSHPDLSREEMIDRVASAAYNIGTRTGYVLTDLKPQNYGFRTDGSAIIFDFNPDMMADSVQLADYKKMITLASNTKV
jgi:hypothetical protein